MRVCLCAVAAAAAVRHLLMLFVLILRSLTVFDIGPRVPLAGKDG